MDVSSTSDAVVLVNHSELPPLPKDRVLAAVCARIVEDKAPGSGDDDVRSSVTLATVSNPGI